jgi:predicted RNA binding protein YcfA (HicA-like mRNA interferase family)
LSRVLSRSVVREAIKLIEADGWREVTTKGSVSR